MSRFVPDENFLARWTSGELSEAELAEWKASPDYKEYKRILDTSAALELPATRSESDIWNELSAKLSDAPVVPLKPKKVLRPQWMLAAAAAVALLFALFIFIPDTSTHQTLAAETEKVVLPDGSLVHLHAASRVSFANDWEDERNVKLTGEAFFEVKKGSKFTVTTQQGTVQVLGTSFNVKTRTNIFETTCYTGKVQVESFGVDQTQVLTPGLFSQIDEKGSLQSMKMELDGTQPEWMNGKYRFRQAPLTEIIPEFERIFDAKINLEIDDDHVDKRYNFTILSNNLKAELEKLRLVIGETKIIYDAEKQIRILPTP